VAERSGSRPSRIRIRNAGLVQSFFQVPDSNLSTAFLLVRHCWHASLRSHNDDVKITVACCLSHLYLSFQTMTSPSESPNCVRSIDKMSNMTISDEKDHGKDEGETSSVSTGSEHDKTEKLPLNETRNLILHLSAIVGNICSLLLQSAPMDYNDASLDVQFVAAPEIKIYMNELLFGLIDTASSLSINLETAIWKKMELNRRKYPENLCKVTLSNYKFAYSILRAHAQLHFDRERLESTPSTPILPESQRTRANRLCIFTPRQRHRSMDDRRPMLSFRRLSMF